MMPPEELKTPIEDKPQKQRTNLELYYYEKVGSHYYFRITPFAIILLLVSALIGVTIIIFDLRANPPRPTDVNITVPSASPESSENTSIRPVPPRTLQRNPVQANASKPSFIPTPTNMNTTQGKQQ